jgi:hypothetical protein
MVFCLHQRVHLQLPDQYVLVQFQKEIGQKPIQATNFHITKSFSNVNTFKIMLVASTMSNLVVVESKTTCKVDAIRLNHKRLWVAVLLLTIQALNCLLRFPWVKSPALIQDADPGQVVVLCLNQGLCVCGSN